MRLWFIFIKGKQLVGSSSNFSIDHLAKIMSKKNIFYIHVWWKVH